MVETKSDLASEENAPPKTAKQLEKEAKKLAKLEKFKQKQDKKETSSAAVTTKPKEKIEVYHSKTRVVIMTVESKSIVHMLHCDVKVINSRSYVRFSRLNKPSLHNSKTLFSRIFPPKIRFSY